MTYFAQLDDNNIVVCVVVADRDFVESNPELFPGTWVETFRDVEGKTYAGVDFTYDDETQDFTAPVCPIIPIEE
jgi:hypothetical protein